MSHGENVTSRTPTPEPALKIVALGASDVVGVGAHHPATEGWAPRFAALLPGTKRLMRLGISGATAAQIRSQLGLASPAEQSQIASAPADATPTDVPGTATTAGETPATGA